MNDHKQTALHAVANSKIRGTSICELLLQQGCKVDSLDSYGDQPIHKACGSGVTSICLLLLQNGANVNAVNRRGQTSLHMAAMRIRGRRSEAEDDHKLLDVLLQHNAKIDAADCDGNQPLHLACATGTQQTVQHFLNRNANVCATNNYGQTPLHKAVCASEDNPTVCEMLLAKGSLMNATDHDGNTPLHLACQMRKIITTRFLVENGANCSLVNVSGDTLLHLACASRFECVELCDYLISHGVSPCTPDKQGRLPFQVALHKRLGQTFCHLFEILGRSTFNEFQKTAIDDLFALLNYLSSILNTQARYTGVLQIAHYTDIVRRILEFSDKSDTLHRVCLTKLETRRYHPMFQIAVRECDSRLCQLLINHGVSVNGLLQSVNKQGQHCNELPLHLAAKLGHTDICRLLVENGASIDGEIEGKTALQLAITCGKIDVARFLLCYDADLSKVTIGGLPALETVESRKGPMASIVRATETFPEEIVSQGEAALNVYLSCCSEGSAVTVFLRVDVVGRDGAGKTSLTKSLTLQTFKFDEPSTSGVVFDPKCQIIVKETCDWTNPLTSADYPEVYNKNVVVNMADEFDKPEVKDQYFKSKEGPQRRRKREVATVTTASYDEIKPLYDASQSTASDTHSSLQSASSSLASKHLPCKTGVKSNSFGTATACVVRQSSASQQPYEADSTNVDNLIEDGNSRATATGFASNLRSIHKQHETKPNLFSSSPSTEEKLPYKLDETDSGLKYQMRKSSGMKSSNKSQAAGKSNKGKSPSNHIGHHKQKQPPKGRQTKQKETKPSKVLVSSKPRIPYSVDNISDDSTTIVPERIKKDVSMSLRDPSSRQKAKNEIMVTMLDYAGQNVFYITHHLVMSKSGFAYIVFDASKPMDAKTLSVFRSEDGRTIQIPLFNNETNFDRLEEWMSGVHIMEPDQLRRFIIFENVGIRSPVMFLVGTHADMLREEPGMLEEQDKFIRKKLEGTVLAEHVIWASKDVMCFYVDNTLTDVDSGVVDPQVNLLRQKTEEVAHKVARHHRLPVRWLKFDQNVREVKSSNPEKKTITISELMDLGKRVAGIKSLEELSVVLQYLSTRALLMYCPKAMKIGDEEEVVLDIEWLVLQLQKVITIYFEQDVPPMFRNDLKRSKEKGIMTMSFLKHLLSDAGPAQQLVVSLMKHYDLLCQYPAIEVSNLKTSNSCQDFLNFEEEVKGQLDNKEEQDEPDSQAYFIPCLLEHVVGLESLEMEDERKSLPLLLSSAPLRIPQPLFYRVLTLLCKRFRRLPVIYRNVGYFHIYPGHRLEFALNRYSFRFTVLFEAHATPNTKVCAAIRQWIVNIVDKAKQQGMGGLQLQLGFELSGSTSDEFISLDGYQDTRFELYSSEKSREIQCPCRLHLWYPQVQCRDLPLHQELSYATPVKFLTGNSTASCMLDVSKYLDEADDLGDDWRRLWKQLLERPLEEDVARKNSKSPTLYILRRWCRMKHPSEATIGQLMKALNAIYRNDVACVLEEYCQTSETASGEPSSFVLTDSEADKEATQTELNKLAQLIQSNWEEVASSLAPDLFTSSHMNVIRQEHTKRRLQAQDMLEKWRSSLGIKAHRRLLIEALIREDQRYQANEVFGVDLVKQVSPQK
ncbi:uncharacterized protein LOC134181346 isoform X1 [Corticium candelabrum]|uniref:uncharacterized protein LOC134181346 isoform X1 n=1 Tax=Corticium candelabrum TaxID=121492 RepID=UPI002E259DD8|nr:uncharacterized protein LOC134181346 isoform X1 [Corticium candelabrum]